MDPRRRTVEALVAAPVDGDGNETGEIQGLAHLREWVRPLRGVKCGYLDDLFVDPDIAARAPSMRSMRRCVRSASSAAGP